MKSSIQNLLGWLGNIANMLKGKTAEAKADIHNEHKIVVIVNPPPDFYPPTTQGTRAGILVPVSEVKTTEVAATLDSPPNPLLNPPPNFSIPVSIQTPMLLPREALEQPHNSFPVAEDFYSQEDFQRMLKEVAMHKNQNTTVILKEKGESHDL